jgi:hypothetical protein
MALHIYKQFQQAHIMMAIPKSNSGRKSNSEANTVARHQVTGVVPRVGCCAAQKILKTSVRRESKVENPDKSTPHPLFSHGGN